MNTTGPIHISRLRLMAKSAAHYAAGYDETETYAMERGTAVHAMILGGKRVVSMAEGKQRRGKEYDAFKADNPGALILTFNEGQKALAMAASVKRCREAMTVLDGERETLREWKINGRECAGTPDVVSPRFITELKTCPTAHPDRFAWHARKLGYHAQLAWYGDGVVQGGGLPPEQSYIVAVEAVFPFVTTVLALTPGALDRGRRMYRAWWELLQVCEKSNEWPPYAQGVVALDIPDDDQELEFSADDVEAAKPEWAA